MQSKSKALTLSPGSSRRLRNFCARRRGSPGNRPEKLTRTAPGNGPNPVAMAPRTANSASPCCRWRQARDHHCARRGGGDPVSTDIRNGKIAGDQIPENVRDTQNGSQTNKYPGKNDGDTITGTQPGRRGRRGGGGMAGGGTNAPDGGTPPPPPAPTTSPWTATRSK